MVFLHLRTLAKPVIACQLPGFHGHTMGYQACTGRLGGSDGLACRSLGISSALLIFVSGTCSGCCRGQRTS